MKQDGLDRFLLAQQRNYADAEREIAQGRKTTHWIWYVYPQLRGLGRSNFAQLYGIADLTEAAAYLAHPVLGARLRQMMALMLTHRGHRPEDILGGIDALKLRSSATLFAELPGADPVFSEVLNAFYDGQRCDKTLALLGRS
ncbi:hypothetical protein TG4357_00678 [Thalassovita gelatinovora]|uniref:Calpastatin n=1 Tax=Thalassovita gelatinovora TaxID=53501 RepID=A0A0P1F6A6_THAGE|nr:DUF1810 domain-containing protein [Thalassovita gelatinovora]QIZ80936.1 DUF1810 domain-containing protein [Thalassovita gelatinovora]CUH63447.1 hypothetical protein TG4357_00678 [Thalassovita gelatinovora]SEQ67117.1 Uncharacterized protein, DUF1810 family [Thalassovita gelatinovora]